jgi:hypothetical protein
MKECPYEWKVPMVSKKGQKRKKPVEVGTSRKSNILAANPKKVADREKEISVSEKVKKPRQQNTIPNPYKQEKYHARVTNGGPQQKKTIGSTHKEINVLKHEEQGGGDILDIEVPTTSS